jgi:hypothetical protein
MLILNTFFIQKIPSIPDVPPILMTNILYHIVYTIYNFIVEMVVQAFLPVCNWFLIIKNAGFVGGLARRFCVRLYDVMLFSFLPFIAPP